MQITTPADIENVAWEGHLEPLGQSQKGADIRPRITLGEPDWWPAAEAVAAKTGQSWSPPAADRRYTLLRLACTLHPLPARTRYTEATLTAYLRPGRSGQQPVIAHDLCPLRLTAESKGKMSFTLGPELKFADLIAGKVAEVGTEIEYRQVFPVIQGYGLSESRPYWRFSHHAAHPLLGSQFVYLVLAAPAETAATRLSVELTATVETRFGPIRVGLPQAALPAHFSWRIEG